MTNRMCLTLAAVAIVAAASTAAAQTYEYDAAGRLTSVRYDDGSAISYAYDHNGNITRMSSLVAAIGDERRIGTMAMEARPNPASERAVIVFELDRTRDVEVAMTAADGRVVMRRRLERAPAGEHTLAWSAADLDGALVPSGVYLVTIEARDGDDVRRAVETMVILR